MSRSGKFQVVLGDLIFGHTWESASISRWTHVSKLLKKWLLGALGSGVLPQALRDVQLWWGIQSSMESALAKLVAADSGDYSSREKLKLLRQVCGLSVVE